MSAPALEIRGLKSGYGDTLIIKGVDLTLHRGEVLGLIGESGAGKSTLGLAAITSLMAIAILRAQPEVSH